MFVGEELIKGALRGSDLSKVCGEEEREGFEGVVFHTHGYVEFGLWMQCGTRIIN